MPKIPTSTSSPPDTKPYLITSSSNESLRSISPPATPVKARGKGRQWTAAEKLTVYEIAIKKGASAKNFEGQVEGRTGQQCDTTWRNTIAPSIKRFLGGHGKNGE